MNHPLRDAAAVVGIGATEFSKDSGRSELQLAVEAITAGLKWHRARPPVAVVGEVGPKDLEACWELGATVAAELVS